MPLDLRGFYPDNTHNQSLIRISETLNENKRYQDEKDYRAQKEKEGKAQQNRLFNLREIDQDTDPTKFKTGEQRFDDYTQSELAKLKDKALSEYVNLDPVEAEYRLSKDMQGLIQWHGAAKANIEKVKTGLTDFNKTYPNINAQKAHERAFLELGNDFLEKDENGQIVRKDPSLVKPRDYVSELNTTDALSDMVEDVSPFADYIQSFKPQKIGAKDYVSKSGYSVKHAYTGELTPFSEVEFDEDGKPVGVKLKSEDFKYNGGTLKMIPEAQFEEMMQVPKVRASIIGMWGKQKQKFEEETGQKITPANEDKMIRGFLYDEIKNRNLDPHFFKTDESQVVPRISVNVSTSGDKQRIDLREQPDVGDGFKDITSMMGGIKTSVLPDGKSFNAEQVFYNPANKKVKYIEYVSKDDAGKYGTPKWKEVSLTKFKQDVKTSNPNTDMKFLDGLESPITGDKKPSSDGVKIYHFNGKPFNEEQIKNAAKQSGISFEEYIKKFGIK